MKRILSDFRPSGLKDVVFLVFLAAVLIWRDPAHTVFTLVLAVALFAARRIWYHYRPYKPPVPQPETRYTRN